MSRTRDSQPRSVGAPQRAARPARGEDAVNKVARTPGGELPTAIRRSMKSRFGADFADVRVHVDQPAADAANELGARAFAVDRHIAFSQGAYAPHSAEGRKLLAHELAHVVQQRRGGAATDAETRADRAADAATGGGEVDAQQLGGAPVGVQAQPNDKKPGDKQPSDAPKEPPKAEEKDKADDFEGIKFSKVLDKFALDKADLTSAHDKAIEEIALGISLHTGLRKRGKARVEIVGHTDTSGEEEHNNKLGQNRADAVKAALEKKLAGDRPPTVEWATRSVGESELLVATADKTHEPRNRAVEVLVTIESIPESAPATKPAQTPTTPPILDPRKILRPGSIPIPTNPPPEEDLWKRMEEMQRKIDEYDRKHPREKKSLQDAVIDAVMDSVVDPLVGKLPVSKSLRDKARKAIRDGLETGSEKACESAIDATGAQGEEAEALKAACKAAIKMKSGEKGSGGGKP